jgi:hypothetical protein
MAWERLLLVSIKGTIILYYVQYNDTGTHHVAALHTIILPTIEKYNKVLV